MSTKTDDKSGDCRSPAGITIGLIDSLISVNRVLSARLTEPFADENYTDAELQQIREAIEDLAADEDFNVLRHEVRHAEQKRRRSALAAAQDAVNNSVLLMPDIGEEE